MVPVAGGPRWAASAEGRRGRPCLQVGRRCPQRGRRWRLLVRRCRWRGRACPPRGRACRTCSSVPRGCPVVAWAVWPGRRCQTSSGRAWDRCSVRIPRGPRCPTRWRGLSRRLRHPTSGHVPGSARSAHRVRHPSQAWQGVPEEPVFPGRALESEPRGLRRLQCPAVRASAPGQAQPAGQGADSRRSRRRFRARSAGQGVVGLVPARSLARSATGLDSPRRSRRFRVRTSPARAAEWPAPTGPDGPGSAT